MSHETPFIENPMVGIAAIIALGIGAQWLAWRLRVPSILLLLITGFVAGPVTGVLSPEAILGDLLFPIVSVSVGLILFEGGMSLRLSELREIGGAVRNLILFGIPLTWLMISSAAALLLDFDLKLSILFGAILVVTGPTVVLPLLRYLRPVGHVGSILKWEGILNDPVGATCAVLVLESMLLGHESHGWLGGVVRTLLIGSAVGFFSTQCLVSLMRRYWIPDFLQAGVTLGAVVSAFTWSNMMQEESGLLTVTVMGIVLANQKSVAVKHILEFKENLRVVLISCLFIILAARLEPSALEGVNWVKGFGFLAVLILVVRPLSVFLSTAGTSLTWQEKLFVAWMAPRGIVAAAVASLFGITLMKDAYPGAEKLVPITFLVIVGTITVYGLTAYPLGLWAKVTTSKAQGVLMVGAHLWARKIGEVLQAEGFPVLLADTNRGNVNAARMAGMPTYFGNILAESAMEKLNLDGIGRMLAVTANDEANSLASLHFAEVFDRSEVYQLTVEKDAETNSEKDTPLHLRGRSLFGNGRTYEDLTDRYFHGAMIKVTNLTDEFGFDAFRELYGDKGVPLFLITEKRELRVFAQGHTLKPESGSRLLSLVLPVEKPVETTTNESDASVEVV